MTREVSMHWIRVYVLISLVWMLYGEITLGKKIKESDNEFISYLALILTGLLWPAIILKTIYTLGRTK